MSLLTLPLELVAAICDYLPNKDIKRLRLTCLALSHHAPLNLSTVYLSPNRANIDVFLAVAGHQAFRNRVKEIIWDDAQLLDYRNMFRFSAEYNEDCFFPCGASTEVEDPRSSALPEYYNRRKELWGAEPTAVMQAAKPYSHYRYRLLREQEAIVAAGEDVAALRTGLRAFSNLTRVTVTAEAWAPRWLFPRHETPFFRSLPPNFWMPLPRAWHGDVVDRHRRNARLRPLCFSSANDPDPEADHHQHLDWETHLSRPWSEERRCFRGYTAVVTELLAYHAENPAHSIRELLVDVNRSPNGLHHALFIEPHPSSSSSSSPSSSPPPGQEQRDDYLRTLTLFSALPLTRLDLAVNAYCPRALHGSPGIASPWHCFGPGLRAALAGLANLRHFSLSSTSVTAADRDACYLAEEPPARVDAWIPAARWPRLASFALGRLVVDADALAGLLAALPTAALGRVELDSLAFPPPSSTCDALRRLRREVVGGAAASRSGNAAAAAAAAAWKRGAPTVVVMEELGPDARRGRGGRRRLLEEGAGREKEPKPRRLRLVVDREVDEFLYAADPARWDTEGDFPCPFEEGKAGLGSVRAGVGRVVDDYDPEYCTPNKVIR